MPIDPNIPLQVQNIKLESPMNQLAMMGEAVKLGEMQRGVETQNKLRELYSQGIDVSTPEGFKQVAALDPATALKLRTDALKNIELQGNIKKTGIEVNQKTYDFAKQKMADLSFNPSDNNIKAHLEDGVLKGEVTPAQAQATWQQVSALNPEQRKAYFIDLGVKVEERYKMNTISAAQQQANATTMRGQDLTNQRALESQRLQYGPDVVANTVTDSAGNVTQFNRKGEIIGKPGAVGKPSATFEKTAALQKQMGRDLDLAITEIENAIKKGGTLDKSTASGAGRLLDAAGNFIGYATEGSIAAASLKPIADLGLKMVPRFEGPQSDKDTASYKEAAGQLANESLPVATRRAAGETVVRLMKSRKGQFVNQTMANEGIGANTPALPPGFTPDK
jgi:hypothetical protein